MTYLLLNAVFLAAAALVTILAVARRHGSGRFAAAATIALALTLVLTAIFDNLMIGVGLFSYDPARISGVLIGRAPLEDFAYPLAAAIGLPALWVLVGGTGRAIGASDD